MGKKIERALISVYDKEGIDPLVKKLDSLGVEIISTGGTKSHIESLNIDVKSVESLTDYPSILGGRVKTLHPKIFGGILAMRNKEHREELEKYVIPEIDLVIVDLYPFEETLSNTNSETEIIEQIDIGGIALIRAAAKNYKDVVVIPSKEEYKSLEKILDSDATTEIEVRKELASRAFRISSSYDYLIENYLSSDKSDEFLVKESPRRELRYGENPHQSGQFYGNFSDYLEQLNGKELSYNNLNDVDSALKVMSDLPSDKHCCAVIKHTNTCGIAVRESIMKAWKDALAGDPVSAFGGIIIFNQEITESVAEEIHDMFYEVLIAPSFSMAALELLKSKEKRILLRLKQYPDDKTTYKSVLGGVLVQETNTKIVQKQDLEYATELKPDKEEIENLLFADLCVKHLKSNAIALTKDMQLIGIGTGQTSRVDALRQAIDKAKRMEFNVEGAVMSSDAFFPFSDCVEIADKQGIKLVVQPGGSIRDDESIEYCNKNDMKMVMTGTRHFKHG